MNHNNKIGFFSYLWTFERFFTIVLIIAAAVLVATVAASWQYEGYERTTTLQICGGLALLLFGFSGFKLVQSYRDHLNGKSR